MNAVMYLRVSSREQEREGYSIPAQRKLLTYYAASRELQVVATFIDIESAKNPGRKEFQAMLRFLQTHSDCRVVLVEKTDRLYRNRTDAIALQELIERGHVEIHLAKEGRVVGKDSRSQDKFMHDIHLAVATLYCENLKEEVKKGMREKAEQGTYPGRAPFGYRNDRTNRTIVVDPDRAPVLKRLFELYGSGQYTLTSLRKALRDETGIRLSRGYLETVLKNRFYLGYFVWQEIEYKGQHPPLIDSALFDRVQAVFAGRHRPRHRKHDFAFAGLLRCAHDGCTVTAEHHKGKYTYYRCSFGRGRCDLPYMPEPAVSDKLGEILDSIYVPEEIAAAIVSSLESDSSRIEATRQQELCAARQRLATLRTRMDQMYEEQTGWQD